MAQSQSAQEPTEPRTPVTGTIVGHHLVRGDLWTAVVAQRPQQWATGAGTELIGFDRVKATRVVVDSRENELSSGSGSHLMPL